MSKIFDRTIGEEPPFPIDYSRTVVCDGEVTKSDIYHFMRLGIFRHGVNASAVECIQRFSDCVYITFLAKVTADKFLQNHLSVFINDKELEVRPLEGNEKYPESTKIRKVFVKQLPSEFPKFKLINCLAQYGEVVSIESENYRQEHLEDIGTGTFIVKMLMKHPVPNFLYIGNYRALCNYSTMIKTCRKCGNEGHLAKSCDAPITSSSTESSTDLNRRNTSATSNISKPCCATTEPELDVTGAKSKRTKKKKRNQSRQLMEYFVI